MSIENVSAALKRMAPKIKLLVVVGVGNEISGDDAAGPIVIKRLAHWLLNYRLLNAGTVPENFVSDIAGDNPSHVIFIDAAALSGEPGTVELVSLDALDGVIATTHHIPLRRVIERLMTKCDCEVTVIGIKPATLEMGAHLSLPVSRAVSDLVDAFLDLSVKMRKHGHPL